MSLFVFLPKIKLILSGEIPVPGRLYVNILLDKIFPFLMTDLATMLFLPPSFAFFSFCHCEEAPGADTAIQSVEARILDFFFERQRRDPISARGIAPGNTSQKNEKP